MENKSELVEFAADIVAAYVGNNSIPVTELPSLINDVIRALNGAVSTGGETALEEARPAVPIKKSVTPDYIICLEDGEEVQVAEAPSAHRLVHRFADVRHLR